MASSSQVCYLQFALLSLSLLIIISFPSNVHGLKQVFEVQRRFARNHPFSELKKHTALRHARLLSGRGTTTAQPVDIPLGGNWNIGAYYTDISIGTPPRNYTVIIDTGSHITWVYCKGCVGCPMDNKELGMHLKPYDPRASSTSTNVTFGDDYCSEIKEARADDVCGFHVEYMDGTSDDMQFVRDVLTFRTVAGDHQTQPSKAKVVFGCVTRENITQKAEGIYLQDGLEGLIGFGNSKKTIISQLAANGLVRQEFAHCLDTSKGGGIFAIGHVVNPKVEKFTPLDRSIDVSPLYIALITGIDIGGKPIFKPKTTDQARVMFDSGMTMGVLNEAVYDALVESMFSDKPNTMNHGEYSNCFNYSGRIDDGFPTMNFQFNNSATYKIYPRDYATLVEKDLWCIFWKKGSSDEGFIFGDLALNNRLVVYDIENMAIGWTEYDCSSTIEVEDEKSGVCSFDVDAHAENSPSIRNNTGHLYHGP